MQLPGLVEPIHSLGKLERDFNFTGGQHATLAPPQLQRLHPSSNHTPLLAVQAYGRVSSFLDALLPLSLRLAVQQNRRA